MPQTSLPTGFATYVHTLELRPYSITVPWLGKPTTASDSIMYPSDENPTAINPGSIVFTCVFACVHLVDFSGFFFGGGGIASRNKRCTWRRVTLLYMVC